MKLKNYIKPETETLRLQMESLLQANTIDNTGNGPGQSEDDFQHEIPTVGDDDNITVGSKGHGWGVESWDD